MCSGLEVQPKHKVLLFLIYFFCAQKGAGGGCFKNGEQIGLSQYAIYISQSGQPVFLKALHKSIYTSILYISAISSPFYYKHIAVSQIMP